MPIQTEKYDVNPNTAPPPTEGYGQPLQERPTEADSAALTDLIKATSGPSAPITILKNAGT